MGGVPYWWGARHLGGDVCPVALDTPWYRIVVSVANFVVSSFCEMESRVLIAGSVGGTPSPPMGALVHQS